jgi:hypothetical protein
VSWTPGGLGLRAFVTNNPITGFPLGSACAVVAGGRAATIVSLPVPRQRAAVARWIASRLCVECTGFRLESHRGSDRRSAQYGAGTVLHRPQSCGALALIAAERAARDPAVNARATGVYVFGCPRAGGDAFFNSYTPLFGDSTFRLVHGSDIVATVPPAGLFRHVGQLIQCASGRLFTSQTPMSDHDKRQTRDG